MSLDDLRKRCNQEWPAIAAAQQTAAVKFAQVRALVATPPLPGGPIDSEDISVVVFGSLARGEWTRGSDLDWTLLIDGQADQEHANTALRTAGLFQEAGFKEPGPTGVFGSTTFSHNVIHQIGGQDDTNRNTTQRMLLLLESRAVNRPEAHSRVIAGILRRYLQNDFRSFRPKVPRFLLNDVHRFWRTVCVDYANKIRARAGKGWALRNIKLRTSRKLLFAAGLLACYACDPELLTQKDRALAANPPVEAMVDYLGKFLARPPLDIVADALANYGKPANAVEMLGAYERFLARLDAEGVREHLEELRPEDADGDPLFQELDSVCRSFQVALQRLFFDDHPRLADLTREYGVF